MFVKVLVFVAFLGLTLGTPQKFETRSFKVGIEYEHSLPMNRASDRYRHKNNYDPFFVTVSATAKTGYVISYLEVDATVDEGGEVDFHLLSGQTGSKVMLFQLVSNKTDFLKYSYLVYGIKDAEYKKIANIINVPIPTNRGSGLKSHLCNLFMFVGLAVFTYVYYKWMFYMFSDYNFDGKGPLPSSYRIR